MARKRGKAYKQAAALVDGDRLYSLEEAVAIVKKAAWAKFDETVEVAMKLGVDPRHADQQVRGTVVLPHGTGRQVRVAVFARGEKAQEAEAAGADIVGAEDLIERIQQGQIDFDAAVATPDMMALVGRVGRILGPRGLMPNPRTGTVTMDIEKAVRDIKAGRVEYRVNREAGMHVPIGKVSFEESQLIENFRTLIDAVQKARPAAAKGQYFRKIALSSTMGPGVALDVPEVLAALRDSSGS